MKIPFPIAVVFVLFVNTQAYGQGMGAIPQTADIAPQPASGHGGATNGASLIRTKNGITGMVSMPTPVPGAYVYPPDSCPTPTVGVMGSPETFTLWLFNFDDPDACSDADGNVPPEGPPVCDSDDVFADPPRGGAFNIGGHVVGGPNLKIAGTVTKNDTPGAGAPLENPQGSETHLAIAPHGDLDPAIMPAQIKTPIGCPPLWWAAVFIAP